MNQKYVVCTLLGMSIAECFCPVTIKHFQPHPPEIEQVEPARTVAEWQVSGVITPGAHGLTMGITR
jgi:hypothetical protein